MVSVYVRETLIQLWTPDAVRGRVNAVNMVFIGASNELGEFRAGTVAALIGVVPAVVIGGVGTIVVAGLWAWWFPDIRRVRRSTDAPEVVKYPVTPFTAGSGGPIASGRPSQAGRRTNASTCVPRPSPPLPPPL